MGHTFQGKRVSRRWAKVLRAADKTLNFKLNSGRRTLREQGVLFRQNMYGVNRPKPGKPLTAWPNPFAPHIRVIPPHALDVDMWAEDGPEDLMRWLNRRGARATRPVPGELWHIEVRAGDLQRVLRYVKKHGGK